VGWPGAGLDLDVSRRVTQALAVSVHELALQQLHHALAVGLEIGGPTHGGPVAVLREHVVHGLDQRLLGRVVHEAQQLAAQAFLVPGAAADRGADGVAVHRALRDLLHHVSQLAVALPLAGVAIYGLVDQGGGDGYGAIVISSIS
jgi:hypothetical protein